MQSINVFIDVHQGARRRGMHPVSIVQYSMVRHSTIGWAGTKARKAREKDVFPRGRRGRSGLFSVDRAGFCTLY